MKEKKVTSFCSKKRRMAQKARRRRQSRPDNEVLVNLKFMKS